MSNLYIQFFGDFRILGEGNLQARLNSPRTQALVAFLVLHHDTPQPRYHVAFQLWPDAGEAQARGNLRYQLHTLKRALPNVDDYLFTDDLVLHWRSVDAATSDLQEFDRALDQAAAAKQAGSSTEHRAHLERALNLYRGDLLPSCYDDWILPERERYHQRFGAALQELVEMAADGREYRAAIALAQRLLRHDPLVEATYRRLMQYHAAIADRVGAVRVYHTCAAVLKRELDVEPGPATRAEYERILQSGATPTAASKPPSSAGKPGTGARSHRVNRLPISLTSFVGRERELALVKEQIAATRLLTLTGAGGSGKTRLALEAAAGLDLEGTFPDGVWWVDLDALTDSGLVPQVILAALGLGQEPARSPEQVLLEQLAPRRMLLVLDNCEHVLAACRQWVESTLRACPGVRILATSREPLGVAGETTYLVPPLAVPQRPERGSARADPAADAMQYEAVRLFVERAGQNLPTFVLNDRNARAVQNICRRLDGIPLAIELAAARTRVLSPAQIASRLDTGLALLTAGKRASLPRHRTLRATLDWSYKLLSDPERLLLRRLSVFAGGFTLEAAEAVAGDDGSPPPDAGAAHFLPRADVLDLLSALVDRSLVVAQPEQAQDESARYRLLELVRQYAHEKLADAREADEFRRRHGQFFLALANELFADLGGPRQAAALHRFEREHDNLRAALQESRDGGDIELGLYLGGALARFWWTRGHGREGREQLRRLLENSSTASMEARARALVSAGWLEWRLGNFETARVLAEENLELQRELENPVDVVYALFLLANAQGDDKRARAEELLQESLNVAREYGDLRGMANALNNLGEIARQNGEYARAEEYYQEVLRLNRDLDTPETLSLALHNLGQIALARGDYDSAAARFHAGLAIYLELEHRPGIAMCLAGISALRVEQGDLQGAIRLAAAVDSILGEIHGHLDPADQVPFQTRLAHARSRLGQEAFDAGQAAARAALAEFDAETELGQIVAYATQNPGIAPEPPPRAGA